MDSLVTKGVPFLHVDLGNFASTEDAVADYKTRFIWQVMADAACAATTPGSRELTLWSTYKDLMASNTIPVVSSNLKLVEAGAEKPVGVPYLVVPVNGLKVALFALMGGDEYAAARPPEGVEFKFEDPFQVAAEMVPVLRKQADVVVLMSEMQTGDTDRLIQTVPGIDVALYGNRAPWVEDAVKNGTTIVQQTGIRGQYKGELVLIVDPEGKILDFGSRNAAMDKAFPESDEVAKAVAATDEKVKQIQAESREKRQGEFENKISGERFLGPENCKRCHEDQYKNWSQTPHAHAFATLEKDKKHDDPNCVKCHVTGGEDPDGYAANRTTPDLRNVGCEVCHGKGTEHDRSTPLAITEAMCRTCHQGEFEKGFNFAAALPLVSH